MLGYGHPQPCLFYMGAGPPSDGLQAPSALYLAFYMGAGDPNTCPYACRTHAHTHWAFISLATTYAFHVNIFNSYLSSFNCYLEREVTNLLVNTKRCCSLQPCCLLHSVGLAAHSFFYLVSCNNLGLSNQTRKTKREGRPNQSPTEISNPVTRFNTFVS